MVIVGSVRRFARQLLLGCVVIAAFGACAKKPASDPGPLQRYEVDGILVQLPDGPARELMIRHVAIPDFVNAVGDTVGMDAMTMGFPVADPAVLEGFAPGDSIRFVFEVRWAGSPPLRLTSMQPLPAGTELRFGKVGEP